jgi:hypothetical protein
MPPAFGAHLPRDSVFGGRGLWWSAPRSRRPRSGLLRASVVDGLCVGSGGVGAWGGHGAAISGCFVAGVECASVSVRMRADSFSVTSHAIGARAGARGIPLCLACDTLGLLCCRHVNNPTKNTVFNCLPPDGEGPCSSVSLGVSLLLWCGPILHSLFGIAAPSARLL